MRTLLKSSLIAWSTALALALAASPAAADEPAPVAATASSSLPSDGEAIRQNALDGDESTAFATEGPAAEGDHLTLTFDEPVALDRVRVLAGSDDPIADAALEVSGDGERFEPLADVEDGEAVAEPGGRRVKALRIRVSGSADRPLVVREIAIESVPPVARFAVPIEFIATSDDPEMSDWVERAARACERAYPMLAEELRSEGYTPPRVVRMNLSNDYRGVAATGGDRIVGSVRYFRDHPDDVGAMVHEAAHVVQSYRGRRNPGWLVEGVADYVRFFKYEPENLGRIDPDRARYDASYRVSAAFLAYLVDRYDPELVRALNAAMRERRYDPSIFEERTGKPLEELGAEWKASLRP